MMEEKGGNSNKKSLKILGALLVAYGILHFTYLRPTETIPDAKVEELNEFYKMHQQAVQQDQKAAEDKKNGVSAQPSKPGISNQSTSGVVAKKSWSTTTEGLDPTSNSAASPTSGAPEVSAMKQPAEPESKSNVKQTVAATSTEPGSGEQGESVKTESSTPEQVQNQKTNLELETPTPTTDNTSNGSKDNNSTAARSSTSNRYLYLRFYRFVVRVAISPALTDQQVAAMKLAFKNSCLMSSSTAPTNGKCKNGIVAPEALLKSLATANRKSLEWDGPVVIAQHQIVVSDLDGLTENAKNLSRTIQFLPSNMITTGTMVSLGLETYLVNESPANRQPSSWSETTLPIMRVYVTNSTGI
jgi:hypothetical protein